MNLHTSIHHVTKVTVTTPQLKTLHGHERYQVQYITVTTADGHQMVLDLFLEDEQSQQSRN